MVKGKPWDLDDEKKLIDWFKSGTTSFRVLSFSFEGKYSENAIYQKLLDLGLLKEEEDAKHHSSSSSSNHSSSHTHHHNHHQACKDSYPAVAATTSGNHVKAQHRNASIPQRE